MARSDWSDLPDEYDPDASREISRVDRFQQMQMTRVGPDPNGGGELVYLEDIPVKFGTQGRSATYRCGTPERSHSQQASWWRVEWKVATGAGVVSQEELVVSLTPHASGWFRRLPFKSANHKTTGRSMPLATDKNAAIQQIEELSYDYWESGKYLTAGISMPLEPALRSFRGGVSGYWLLGLCANVDDYVTQLREHFKVQNWLAMTERGTIVFWNTKAPLKSTPRLLPETIDERETLMNIAIMQALAGPDAPTPDSYLNKPVVEWVHRRYVDHLNNRNRQLSRRR